MFNYFRLFLFTGLTIINFISVIAHSAETVELQFKFKDREQAELLTINKDIIQSLKTIDNMTHYFDVNERVVKDIVPLRVGPSVFHEIIRVLSAVKVMLHADEMRRSKTVLETYSISQTDPQKLQDSVEEVLNLMLLPSNELLGMIEVADYLNVEAIYNAGVKLWAKKYSASPSRFSSLNAYIQEAIISKLDPQAFLTLMQVNESNLQEDYEQLFSIALLVHYKEEPPEGVTAKEHYERPRIEANFVLIPGGDYQIGSPLTEVNRYSNENPHLISLSPFLIMDAAVTQEFYAMKMGYNPSRFKEQIYCPESFKTIEVNGVQISVLFDHPVENVSYDDAIAFAKVLSKQDPLYNYSLATEAQLEVAFRGGTTTAYVSGDNQAGLQEYVWYHANSENKTHPVKIKRANDFGIYRSSVWEWAQDWYDTDYSGSTGLDPQGPISGLYRVLRGGCWDYGAQYCRSAHRSLDEPDDPYGSLGFRLVRTRK